MNTKEFRQIIAEEVRKAIRAEFKQVLAEHAAGQLVQKPYINENISYTSDNVAPVKHDKSALRAKMAEMMGGIPKPNTNRVNLPESTPEAPVNDFSAFLADTVENFTAADFKNLKNIEG